MEMKESDDFQNGKSLGVRGIHWLKFVQGRATGIRVMVSLMHIGG